MSWPDVVLIVIVASLLTLPVQGDELTATQVRRLRALCGKGGFASDIYGDCCHFWHCDEAGQVYKQACLGGTVWHPELYACVHSRDYKSCNQTECTLDLVLGKSCPDKTLLSSLGKCCINGEIYTALNSTTYRFDAYDGNNSCPTGQVFSLNDCGCIGDIHDENCSGCYYWPFALGLMDFFCDNQAVTNEGVYITNGDGARGANDNSLTLGYASSHISLPRFTNGYFGNMFSISLWFKDEGGNGGSLISNGGFGEAATIRLELLDPIRITGGFSAVDGSYDFLNYLETDSTSGWHVVSLSYNKGLITLCLDGDIYHYEEQAPLDAFSSLLLAEVQFPNFKDTVLNIIQRADNTLTDVQADVDTTPYLAIFNAMFSALETLSDAIMDFASVQDLALGVQGRLESDVELDLMELQELKTLCGNFLNTLMTSRNEIRVILSSLEEDVIDDIMNILLNGNHPNMTQLAKLLHWAEVLTRQELPSIAYDDMMAVAENYKGLVDVFEDFDELREAGQVQSFPDWSDILEAVIDHHSYPWNIQNTKVPLSIGLGFVGMVDELVVCDFAWTDAEIESYKDIGSIPDPPGGR
ncbi:unnamed protein product [Owenia fusiformis]|uniref:Uncharacterized protein n=1 Tax=Owenia fusiformis TaxID=6347 RepID=A0A8J1TCD7_OWEFU|nr:unnamed protein product [Owenia fusiformis]